MMATEIAEFLEDANSIMNVVLSEPFKEEFEPLDAVTVDSGDFTLQLSSMDHPGSAHTTHRNTPLSFDDVENKPVSTKSEAVAADGVKPSRKRVWADNDLMEEYISQLRPKDCVIIIEQCRPFNSNSVFMKHFKEHYLCPILTHLNGGPPLHADFGRDRYTSLYSLLTYGWRDPTPVPLCRDTPLIYRILKHAESMQHTDRHANSGKEMHGTNAAHLLSGALDEFAAFDRYRAGSCQSERHLILLAVTELDLGPMEALAGVGRKLKANEVNFTLFSPVKSESFCRVFEMLSGVERAVPWSDAKWQTLLVADILQPVLRGPTNGSSGLIIPAPNNHNQPLQQDLLPFGGAVRGQGRSRGQEAVSGEPTSLLPTAVTGIEQAPAPSSVASDSVCTPQGVTPSPLPPSTPCTTEQQFGGNHGNHADGLQHPSATSGMYFQSGAAQPPNVIFSHASQQSPQQGGSGPLIVVQPVQVPQGQSGYQSQQLLPLWEGSVAFANFKDRKPCKIRLYIESNTATDVSRLNMQLWGMTAIFFHCRLAREHPLLNHIRYPSGGSAPTRVFVDIPEPDDLQFLLNVLRPGPLGPFNATPQAMAVGFLQPSTPPNMVQANTVFHIVLWASNNKIIGAIPADGDKFRNDLSVLTASKRAKPQPAQAPPAMITGYSGGPATLVSNSVGLYPQSGGGAQQSAGVQPVSQAQQQPQTMIQVPVGGVGAGQIHLGQQVLYTTGGPNPANQMVTNRLLLTRTGSGPPPPAPTPGAGPYNAAPGPPYAAPPPTPGTIQRGVLTMPSYRAPGGGMYGGAGGRMGATGAAATTSGNIMDGGGPAPMYHQASSIYDPQLRPNY